MKTVCEIIKSSILLTLFYLEKRNKLYLDINLRVIEEGFFDEPRM